MTEVVVPWWPQPKQEQVLRAAGLYHPFSGEDEPQPPIASILGLGGAAGGGKTDVLLGMAIIAAVTWPKCQIGFFRRTFPELSGPGGAIMRSMELLTGLARWTGTNHRWTFPNGSVVQFCHCQREQDVHQYQSQQFDLLLIDEATHFTEWQVRYLMTRNRATVEGLIPLCAMATNPGGVGHLWFRNWFVDIGEWGKPHEFVTESGHTETHIFVPARLEDNPILEARDPGYRDRLLAQPLATMKALLLGDWDTFEGQVFTEWRRSLHVCEPFSIPEHWKHWIAVDWGYAAPWCTLWLAMDPDTRRVYVYREAYQAGLTDPEQAETITSLTRPTEKLGDGLADPSMWTRSSMERQTKSTYDVYRENGVRLKKADNHRLIGKRRVHDALATDESGQPGIQFFTTCTNLIRTLPALPYSQVDVEDVDTNAEDHAYDALRYGLTYHVKRRGDSIPPRKSRSRGKLDLPIEMQTLENDLREGR